MKTINDTGIDVYYQYFIRWYLLQQLFLNNGMLPLTLPCDQVEILLKDFATGGTEITVDVISDQ